MLLSVLRSRRTRPFVLLAVAATVVACGGGSSSSATDQTTTTTTTTPTTTPTTSPTATAWPPVDMTKLPTGAPGVSYDNLVATTDVAPLSTDGTGSFRSVCLFSHMAADDPIVYPGQPGKSHLHAFFGNTGANANSTAASLASTGNSTCRGGTINRTGYWAPAMVDTLDGTPVKPDQMIVYYKTGFAGVQPTAIQAFPVGLRMIAGDSKGSAPVQWGPTWFKCDGVGDATYNIPACAVGSVVWSFVQFPQCWDGVNLDSPDHKSHMAYGTGSGCPSTHPVGLPEVTIIVLTTVTDAEAVKRWRFSSDTYDKSIPAGYSSHADWFDGWKPEIVNVWVNGCDRAARDCKAHLLGDGREMVEAD